MSHEMAMKTYRHHYSFIHVLEKDLKSIIIPSFRAFKILTSQGFKASMNNEGRLVNQCLFESDHQQLDYVIIIALSR